MQQQTLQRSLLSLLLAAFMIIGLGGSLLAAPAPQVDAPVDADSGVLIVAVQPDGPAADAGLVRGDIVLGVDGVAVNSVAELVDLLAAMEPGDEVELSVLHGSETLTLSAVLGNRAGGAYLGVVPYASEQRTAAPTPAPAEETPEVAPEPTPALAEENPEPTPEATEEPAEEPTAEPTEEPAEEPAEEPTEAPTAESAEERQRDVIGLAGAAVAEVLADTPAADAGLQVGDVIVAVNDKVVENAADLAGLIRENAPGDEIRLTVRTLSSDVERTLTAILGQNPQDETLPFLGIRFTMPEALQPEATVPPAEEAEVTVTPVPEEEAPAATPTPMPEEESAQTEAPLVLGEAFEDDGALITEIVPFSPAALAGLNVGDVVLAVDGVAVEAEADLAALIRAYAPDDSVVLSVRNLNSEDVREVEATLDANPQDATLPFLGVRYGMLSSMMTPDVPMPEMTPPAEEEMEESVTPEAPAEERHEGLMPGVIGALVVEVMPGGPAEAAGVIAGDIISAVDGVAITGDADLAELIGDYAPGDEISLTITGMMGQSERTLPVTLGERADEPGKALLGVQYTPFTGGGMRVMPFFDQDTMPMPFGELDSENLPDNFEEFLDQLREQFGDDFNPENFEWLPPEFLNPDQFQPDDGQESL